MCQESNIEGSRINTGTLILILTSLVLQNLISCERTNAAAWGRIFCIKDH